MLCNKPFQNLILCVKTITVSLLAAGGSADLEQIPAWVSVDSWKVNEGMAGLGGLPDMSGR